METGPIDSAQIVLPWNERQKGITGLLELAANEIEKLGSITIFDFTIQGLQMWQGGSYSQEVLTFTYRHDDLVSVPQAKVKPEITVTVLGDNDNVVRLEMETALNAYYDYPALLQWLADTCTQYSDHKLGSIYFDHRLQSDQSQWPFFVLTFIKQSN